MSDAAATRISMRRVYDPPDPDDPPDGHRVLVDRLWPRGLSKAVAATRFDRWMPDVAPSAELRRWYHVDPAAHRAEFRERYLAELDSATHAAGLATLREYARTSLVLLTATHDITAGHVPVLIEVLGLG